MSHQICSPSHHQVPQFYEEIEVMTENNANYTDDSQLCKTQPFAPSSLDNQVSELQSELESLFDVMSPDYSIKNPNAKTQTFEQDLLPPSLNNDVFSSLPAQELLPEMIADHADNNILIRTTSCSLTEENQFSMQDLSSPNTEFHFPSVCKTISTFENQSDMQDPTSPNQSADLIKDSLSELLIFKTEKLNKTSIEDSREMKDSTLKSAHVCPISDYGKVYQDAWLMNEHLDWHGGKKNFFCAHCDERFECKNHLAIHVQRHMDFNETMPKNNNVKSKVLECCQEKDDLGKGNVNTIIDNLNRKIQPSMSNLVLPTLDLKVLKCSPVTKALAKQSTDYSKVSLDYTTNCSSMEQTRVSIQDLLLPLFSTSKASSTHKTEYNVQDLLAELQPCYLSKDLMKNIPAVEEKHCKAENKYEMKDCSGTPWYNFFMPKCEKVYRNTEDLNTHLDWHNSKKSYFCAHCGKGFMGKKTLSCHIRIHMPKVEKLENCVNGGNGSGELCNNPKNVCNIVNKKRLVPTLKIHQKKCSDNKNFFCAYCNKKFKVVADLSKHVKEHINSKESKLQNINMNNCALQNSPMSQLQMMRKLSQTKFEYLNDKDEKKTKSPSSKLRHVCHISGCEKVFTLARNLKRHLGWHSKKSTVADGKLQHACHISNCDRVFTKAYDLKSHLVSHSVIKDFICTYCDKGFACKDILNRHIEAHFSVNRVNIEIDNVDSHVPQSFTILKKDILQKHQQTKYQNPGRSVEGYNKDSSPDSKPGHIRHVTDLERILNLVPDLKMHLQKHTVDDNFFCTYCKQKFTLISDLSKHVHRHVNLNHSRSNIGENTGDSFKSEILPSVQDLVSSPLNLEDLECNSVIKAVPKMSADNSKGLVKNSLDCIKTCSTAEEIRVSIQDLLSSLLSNSQPLSNLFSPAETLSTRGTQNYVQDSATVNSSNYSTNVMLTVEGENLANCKSTSCSDDHGNKMRNSGIRPRYVCPTPNCKRVYKHAGHFKAHLDRHNGKNFFCADCDKRFEYRVHLIRHVKKHMSIKQSMPKNDNVDGGNKTGDLNGKPRRTCRINNNERNSSLVPSLQKLLKIYTGNKRFFCGYCTKKFALITDLRKHVKGHRTSQRKRLKTRIMYSHVPQNVSVSEKQVP